MKCISKTQEKEPQPIESFTQDTRNQDLSPPPPPRLQIITSPISCCFWYQKTTNLIQPHAITNIYYSNGRLGHCIVQFERCVRFKSVCSTDFLLWFGRSSDLTFFVLHSFICPYLILISPAWSVYTVKLHWFQHVFIRVESMIESRLYKSSRKLSFQTSITGQTSRSTLFWLNQALEISSSSDADEAPLNSTLLTPIYSIYLGLVQKGSGQKWHHHW